MHYLSLLSLIFFTACYDSNRQTPYLMHNTPSKKSTIYKNHTSNAIKLATIQAQNKKELAEIEHKKALEIENIKKEIEEKKIQVKKELTLKEQEIKKSSITQKSDEISLLSKIILFIFIISLITLIYFLRKRAKDRLKIHEDTLRLKEKELQVKMAEKMLETLASGNLVAEDGKRMLEIFEKNAKEFPKIKN